MIAQSARMGWMPSLPDVQPQPARPRRRGGRGRARSPAGTSCDELRAGRLRFAGEDPDAPENLPRVLTMWRANLLGSSAKGNEYFLKHLLGADSLAARRRRRRRRPGPRTSSGARRRPPGKLDLLLTLDFRMTSTTLFSDVVLPAATWYEKHDLTTTDMHPFVHSFNPAIAPPWQTRTDFDTFATIAAAFSRLAADAPRRAHATSWRVPLLHDTPDELANPRGVVRDWTGRRVRPGARAGRCRSSSSSERDYGAVAREVGRARPAGGDARRCRPRASPSARTRRSTTCGTRTAPSAAASADGRPALARDVHWCEAILALSGTTNGRLATQGFRLLRGAHRHAAGRPRRRARGQADHLRRHPGAARRR